MRIGIFGGTFDPPHMGHLQIAERARVQLRLNRVLFIPAYVAPHKRNRSSAGHVDRLRMVRLALRGKRDFKVSDIEIKRKSVSYTVETLRQIQKRYPRAKLFLIVGGDNLADFKTWKSHDEIVKLSQLAVYRRSQNFKRLPRGIPRSRVRWLRGPLLKVSSSQIRRIVQQGVSISGLVPAHVEGYIGTRHLYQT